MKRYDDNLILGYVEGELSPDERARFEAQLARDAALRELVTDLARDRAAVRELPREEPPPHVIEDVMQRLERSMLLGDPAQPLVVEPAEHRRFRIGRVLSYSGLAAIILISGGILLHTLTDVDLLDETARYASVGEWVETEGDQFALAPPTPSDAPRSSAEPRVGAPTATPADAARDVTPETESRLAAADGANEAADLDAPTEPTAPTRGATAMRDDAGAEADDASAGQPMAGAEPATGDTTIALAPTPTLGRAGGTESGAMLSMEVEEPTAETMAGTTFSLRPYGLLDRLREESATRMAWSENQAPMQVNIVAREPRAARQDVLDWAMRNQVAVTTVAVSDRTGREETPMRAMAAATNEQPPAASEQLVVQVQPDQVPELLSYLNRTTDQRAGLVQSPQVVRRSEQPQRQEEPFDYYGGYRRADDGRAEAVAPPSTQPALVAKSTADAAEYAESLRDAAPRERVAARPDPLPTAGLQPTPTPREKLPGGALPPPAAAMQPTQFDESVAGPTQGPPPLLSRWWTPADPVQSMRLSVDDAGLVNILPSQATIALPIVITEDPADPAR